MKNLLWLLLVTSAMSLNAQKKETLFIADHKEICPDANDDCFLIKKKQKETYRFFNGKISGMDYRESTEYKVRATYSAAANSYQVVKVLSSRKTGFRPASKLDKHRWYLLSLHADSSNMKLLDTSVVYLTFDSETQNVGGKGVCNNFSGSFSATGYDIRFTRIATTRMACEGNILEKIISDMLETISRFNLSTDLLTLTSPQGSRMVLRREKPGKQK